jgi:hypothetical protein
MYTLLKWTEVNPHTIISGQKIFLIYDLPHLIKSVRNNLLNGDFKFDNTKLASMTGPYLRGGGKCPLLPGAANFLAY